MTTEGKNPETEKEQEPDPRLVPSGPDTMNIIVVGSFSWVNVGTVRETIRELWVEHGQPHVNLITSGCPHGAEVFARRYAEEKGWDVVVMRDEDIPSIPSAVALVFVRDQSPGVTAILPTLTERFWTRVLRDDTMRKVSPWASR